jgi:hypothetical protein
MLPSLEAVPLCDVLGKTVDLVGCFYGVRRTRLPDLDKFKAGARKLQIAAWVVVWYV